MLNAFGAFLLPAVPLLIWVAFPLLGRFPGEKAIERLSRRRAASRRPARQDRGARPAVRPHLWAPGGGRLIAFSLDSRPPPALS